MKKATVKVSVAPYKVIIARVKRSVLYEIDLIYENNVKQNRTNVKKRIHDVKRNAYNLLRDTGINEDNTKMNLYFISLRTESTD